MESYSLDVLLLALMLILMAIVLAVAILKPRFYWWVLGQSPLAGILSIMMLIGLIFEKCRRNDRCCDVDYIVAFLTLHTMEAFPFEQIIVLLCYVIIFAYSLKFFVTEDREQRKKYSADAKKHTATDDLVSLIEPGDPLLEIPAAKILFLYFPLILLVLFLYTFLGWLFSP